MPEIGTPNGRQWLGLAVGFVGASLAVTVDPWVGIIGVVGGAFLAGSSDSRARNQPKSGVALTDGGSSGIELVTAIIRPGKINAVKQSLAQAGAPSLTVTNVSGRGAQPTETGQWRGEEYIVDLHQKVKVEIVVPDTKTEHVVEAIQDAAHTGEAGDGKIWVLPVSEVVRVSTEERGPEAI